jgi:hypothetical protein
MWPPSSSIQLLARISSLAGLATEVEVAVRAALPGAEEEPRG